MDDDNEYIVVSKVNYKGLIYYYLLDKNDNSNIKFCYEDNVNEELVEIDDKVLITKLLPLFLKESLNEIDK